METREKGDIVSISRYARGPYLKGTITDVLGPRAVLPLGLCHRNDKRPIPFYIFAIPIWISLTLERSLLNSLDCPPGATFERHYRLISGTDVTYLRPRATTYKRALS